MIVLTEYLEIPLPNAKAGAQLCGRQYVPRRKVLGMWTPLLTDLLGTRANLSYLDALAKFHKQQGTNLNRLPYVDKKPLDLYRLKRAVESRGGFEKVCKSKKWAEIGRDLGYSGKIMSSLSTSLKNSYDRWLNPYENYLRQAKPGVYQQLEQEYGGPLTPSPAPSPMKRSAINTPSSLRAESPARHATDALQASMGGTKQEHDRDSTFNDVPAAPPAQATSGGFTAINSGGFTAVNSGFTSINRPAAAEGKSFTPAKHHASPLPSAKNTPDLRPSILNAATSLKRQLSSDSLDISRKENGTEKDDTENGSRRSKRLKKGEFSYCRIDKPLTFISLVSLHKNGGIFCAVATVTLFDILVPCFMSPAYPCPIPNWHSSAQLGYMLSVHHHMYL